MTAMENEIVKALNTYYKTNNIKALSYRLYQSQYSKGQWCDILSDSLDPKHFLAIECKSIDYTKYKTLNFKSRFSEAEGFHQLEREHFFTEQTGRKGLLIIECRMGPGKPREAFVVDMIHVYNLWKSGEKSLKNITSYNKLKREKGRYVISEEDLG